MKVNGYMLEVEYDGHTLTAQGTTKASQVALRGQNQADGPLVLERDQITGIELKPANRLTNGRLDLQTQAGDRYQLHYRRKDQDAFNLLVHMLNEWQTD